MSNIIEVKVPDIGDFDQVEIIEVLIAVGDTVEVEDSLITVESDKASMEIPSSVSGTITEILINNGDHVAEGSPIVKIEVTDSANASIEEPIQDTKTETIAPISANFAGDADMNATVVVLGSGPGGYTAAFRAADLGLDVIMIERYSSIGGVCLNVGCIPSKALLHTADIINEAEEVSKHGVKFGKPEIDIDAIRSNKEGIVKRLTGGLKQLAKQRKVQIVQGYGKFISANHIAVTAEDGTTTTIGFENCIIAAGSRVTKLPFIPWDDPRVMDSTDALELE
ncbi:MAG TPA: FAD-dependent oxidoreductase, partial [Leucothrix mucor]|nr:FAD-dependent oxidoreductase [Leucothrix mucor]